MLSVTCIQGGYPSHLISEWDKWDTKHTSENDKPGKRYSINCIDIWLSLYFVRILVQALKKDKLIL